MFVLNGYEDLNAFREIKEYELDFFGITDVDKRVSIMKAIELLQEYNGK